jgi:hypothetical protein
MDTLTISRPIFRQSPTPPAWRVRAMLQAMAWAKASGVPFSRYRAVKAL